MIENEDCILMIATCSIEAFREGGPEGDADDVVDVKPWSSCDAEPLGLVGLASALVQGLVVARQW